MLTALLFCGLVAASPPESGDALADLATYEQAKANTASNADSQIRLALWCEAHGLPTERLKHLARAVLIDPKNATARGLLGLVAYKSQWKRPEVVAEKVKADEALLAKLADYNGRRAEIKETAEDHWKLGLWCEENGLEAEAKAHFTNVTRLNPGHDGAWKRLGCKKVNGRWVTETQLASEKAEADAQKQADKKWKPLLTKYRAWLNGNDATKRNDAANALAEITDPRAVSTVWSVLVVTSSKHHDAAVQVLGQIDSGPSSQALAFLAVSDKNAEIRRAAAETLKRRDPREYAGWLVNLLRKPIKYEVRPVGGPGSPGTLIVEGQKAIFKRVYAPPALPVIPVGPNDQVVLDDNGFPVIHHFEQNRFQTGRVPGDQLLAQMSQIGMSGPSWSNNSLTALTDQGGPGLRAAGRAVALGSPPNGNPGSFADTIVRTAANEHTSPSRIGFRTSGTVTREYTIPVGQIVVEANKAAAVAEQQLEADVAPIEEYNKDVQVTNDRLLQVLSGITGSDLDRDQEKWKAWWVNQIGYAYQRPNDVPLPTVVENVPIAYLPSPMPVSLVSQSSVIFYQRQSCFGGGTLVRTFDGSRPIEQIKVGDRVLTQDPTTAALGYQPVTFVHHNPPSPTFLVKIKGDTIVTSPFHRFWVANKGWVMARDLKGGETLRLLDGPAKVDSLKEGPVQRVFNLDVADAHDFFAGLASALVHDNTLPETRLVPFDKAPELTSAK